jgi:SOS response regulatory protein OraA/RecX
MSKNQTQDAITLDDLTLAVEYVTTGNVDKKDVKKVKRTLRRTVNVSDVVTLATALNQRNDQVISQLMDVAQVQSFVLKELGATPEIMEAAKAKYEEVLNEQRAELEAARKKLEEDKAAEKKED